MDVIHSEWIKLSTITVNKLLVIIAIAFPIVVTALVAGLTDDVFSSADVADLIGGLGWLSALLLGVVATIGMSGEFNYNTIRPTFAAQPKRMMPLLAKLLVHLVLTAVLVVAIIAVAWLVATNLLDGTFSLSEGEEFGVSAPRVGLLGLLLLACGVTIVGFGLGNLIRNTPAAVTALLLWPLVVENILARLLFAALDVEWGRYLPFTQGLTLPFADRGEDDAELMSRLGAGLYFYAFVVGITILGLIRTQRSDA
jgi:ABC-2 type transport system permease protein